MECWLQSMQFVISYNKMDDKQIVLGGDKWFR